MCKSRNPFFYTGVIVRVRWRASLRDARCARYNCKGTCSLVFSVFSCMMELCFSKQLAFTFEGIVL